MRNFLFLFALLLVVSCNKRLIYEAHIWGDDEYVFIKDEFTGNSEMREVKNTDGQLLERGNYALDKEGNLSNLKVGEWTSYYENGQLKSQGKYSIGSYIQCCFAGPCRQFNNYKVGFWKYFHSNGQLKASGDYKTSQLHIDTSCKGGDDMFFGLTTPLWKYFDDQGVAIKPTQEELIEFEEIQTGDDLLTSYLLPGATRKKIQIKYDSPNGL